MSFKVYICTIVMILVLIALINYLHKTFYYHGSIQISSTPEKETWTLDFRIPHNKIKKKKYILMRIDVKDEEY